MRTIIAGSRTITDRLLVDRILDSVPWRTGITEVACGMAKGVDSLGALWASGYGIPVKDFPPRLADWDTFWEAAYARNQEMADWCESAVLIWDGLSTGTQDMAKRAAKADALLRIYNLLEYTWTELKGSELVGHGRFNPNPRSV